MKMTRFEKTFVNSRSHSDRVAAAIALRIARIEPRRGERCLDVGCGNGAAAVHLADRFGLDVTGVDIDPDQIRLAEARRGDRNDVRFRIADATALPFAYGTFDVAVSNKTLHHVADWPRALREIARVARPGGLVVFADLMVPRWIATALGLVRQGAVPATAASLRAVAAGAGLLPVAERQAGGTFSATWRKGGSFVERSPRPA